MMVSSSRSRTWSVSPKSTMPGGDLSAGPPLEQFLTGPASRIRLQWLQANAARVTHAELPAVGASPSAPFPPDRVWIKDVLLPPDGESSVAPEFGVDLLDGQISAFFPNRTMLLRERRSPRLGIQRRIPYLSLDPTKLEFRLGARRVEAGIRLSFSIQPDEYFYGWGEMFNAFRRHSGSFKLKIRDAIAPLQAHGETYSALPLFLSSRGYGFLLLNSHTSRWKIDPRRGFLTIEADGPAADYLLIYGPSFKRILQTYTGLTGRPPLLPRWAFGLWTTCYPQGDQASALEHVEQHRKHGIPLDALILDYHWEERFHNFRWRSALFPDPPAFIAGLKQLGVRLGLIQTPFLNLRNRPFQKFLLNRLAHNLPPGLEQDDERALPEYEAAQAQGFLAHPDAKWWFGSGGMPDFANPRAAGWWNGLQRPLYDQGVAFFKNDDGEYLPEDARSAAGMDGCEYHNLYGFYYGRAQFAGAAAARRTSADLRPLGLGRLAALPGALPGRPETYPPGHAEQPAGGSQPEPGGLRLLDRRRLRSGWQDHPRDAHALCPICALLAHRPLLLAPAPGR